MENKTFTGFTKSIDVDQGIVEAVVAVMGNLDLGKDVINAGAFNKTLQENSPKVRVLDNHRTDSVQAVIGIPLEMKEIGRTELPPKLLKKYPEATGGLYTKTQYLMDTPEGEGAFQRIKAGALAEYSIGYDSVDHDFKEINWRGEKVRARILKQVRLWEYSPVIWGMNEGTETISAKGTDPSFEETKPWKIVKEDGKWCVYKIGEDGKPTGKPLGKHDSEEEAQTQIRALHANEKEPKKGKDIKEFNDGRPVQRLGDVLKGSIHKVFTYLCDDWYVMGMLSEDERIKLSNLIGDALETLSGIGDDVFQREIWAYPLSLNHIDPVAEAKNSGTIPESEDQLQVGSEEETPPTETTPPDAEPDELQKRIEALEAEIKLNLLAIEADVHRRNL